MNLRGLIGKTVKVTKSEDGCLYEIGGAWVSKDTGKIRLALVPVDQGAGVILGFREVEFVKAGGKIGFGV